MPPGGSLAEQGAHFAQRRLVGLEGNDARAVWDLHAWTITGGTGTVKWVCHGFLGLAVAGRCGA